MSGTVMAALMVVAYIALLYFLVFGKRKKEKKKLDEINSKLHPGVKIVTISGLCGTVSECPDNREIIVDLSADSGKHIRARLLRGAVKEIVE